MSTVEITIKGPRPLVNIVIAQLLASDFYSNGRPVIESIEDGPVPDPSGRMPSPVRTARLEI